MVRIFEEPVPESHNIAQMIGMGAGRSISDSLNQMLAQKQRTKQLQGLAPIFKQLGLPEEGIQQLISSGLDPAILGPIAGQLGKSQASFAKEERKAQEKKEEKEAPLLGSLNVVERQRELLKSGHLGKKFGVTGGLSEKPKILSTLTKAGRKARAEYERLGKSLIQQSSNIPIRNRQEFETLAESLYDPNLSEAEIEGNLDAMERIIKNSLGSSSTTLKKVTPGTKLTPEIARAIFEKSGGDPEKATKNALEMGYSLD